MIKWIFRFVALGVLISGVVAGVLYHQYTAQGPLQEPRTVMVAKGDSLGKIASELQKNGVIADAFWFRVLGRITNVASQVKVGEYEFTPLMSAKEVMEKIVSGESVIHRFSVPEGFTSAEIVAMLNGVPALSGEMINPDDVKEGSLLPETYYYSYGDNRNDILARMQRSMTQEIDRLWENRYPRLPIKTKEEAIILASIVEKETGVAAERDVVASVFVNRLNKKMRLQSDPTVIYAFKLNRKLYKKDLQKMHPYNTYRVGGLPPGPICNPGIDALRAVLNPAQTTYLYFVADGTGGHAFASDLKSHNRNVAHWRRINQGN